MLEYRTALYRAAPRAALQKVELVGRLTGGWWKVREVGKFWPGVFLVPAHRLFLEVEDVTFAAPAAPCASGTVRALAVDDNGCRPPSAPQRGAL